MEVVEGLLRDLAIDGDVLCRCEGFVRAAKYIVTGDDLGDIAGHQLDARLGELRAALIVDGDPANQIGLLFNGSGRARDVAVFSAGIGSDHVIGGFPTEAAGDVGKLRRKLLRLVGVDLPAQGWLEQQAVRRRGKERGSRKLEAQLAVDFDQRLILAVLVVLALRLGRANDLTLHHGIWDDFAVVVGPAADKEVDGLAFVFLQ